MNTHEVLVKKWQPAKTEIRIPFSPVEYGLYRERKPSCIYHEVRWTHRNGRGRHGEFPLIVASVYFRKEGYKVLFSEPELANELGFLLVSYPGKRRKEHPAYRRMLKVFGNEVLSKLNLKADTLKLKYTGNTAGGDPDLFVFKETERFFVEVKWRDKITNKQSVTFPIIEKYCGVEIKLVRIFENA